MSQELSTIGFSDFTKLAKVLWVKLSESVLNYMRNSGFVKSTPISANSGNTREFSSVCRNQYLTYKGEGEQAARARAQQGYSKTMTKFRVAQNMGITYEMRTENKYPEVLAELTSGAEAGANTMDLDLSHVLTFGTATSYTDRDGRTITTVATGDDLQLWYSAHKLKGSSTTFRNRIANNPRISKGALEGMERLAAEESYNELGEKMVVSYDILWTTDDPNSINTAREYLQSTADVEGANSGVMNVYKGKYRHVILPRVATTASGAIDTSKRYYWGLASSKYSSFYLGVWEEPHMVTPSVGSNMEDKDTDTWDYPVRAGYGIAVVDGRGLLFSSGDGAA